MIVLGGVLTIILSSFQKIDVNWIYEGGISKN